MSTQAPAGVDEKRAQAAFARLPIAFTANEGQFDDRVSFSARGSGYGLLLTQDEAVLSLSTSSARKLRGQDSLLPGHEEIDTGGKVESRAVLRMSLAGANRKARVSGESQLDGKANYFIGSEPEKWRTGVSMFEKVRYQEVYPGIDLVYYGNQQQLEYDFVVAPGADPRRIKLRFDGAREIYTDADGNLVLRTEGGDVRQQKPYIYQLDGGERREVSGRYTIEPGTVGFELGMYDRSEPLIIDPVLSYSSFLGGAGYDQALDVAVDAEGNAYLTGQTDSISFPAVSPIQTAKGAFTDAYVLKLNPGGTALVYATYIGGNGDDIGNSIAVDSTGNAYVTGSTGSGSFPSTAGALQSSKSGSFDAFATKLNAAGNTLLYSTFLGGNNFDHGFGIAVDAGGNAYVTGRADSTTFLGNIPMEKHGSGAYKSTDAGGNWAAINNELSEPNVESIIVDPTNSGTLYAAGAAGVFKSTDGGNLWRLTGQGRVSTSPLGALSVAVDPSSPSTLYAGTFDGFYKSTDGGALWDTITAGISNSGGSVRSIAVDPNTNSTLYAGTFSGVYKSTDRGASWVRTSLGLPSNTQVNKVVFSPANPSTLYAATARGVYKSVDGAANWTAINNGLIQVATTPYTITALVVDPLTPTTMYAATRFGVFKTTDGGANWSGSSNGLFLTNPAGLTVSPFLSSLAIDRSTPSTLYTGSFQHGVFKSTDGGANWTTSNNGLANRIVRDITIDHNAPNKLYVGTSSGSDVFVVKINETGTAYGYLRYLGGDDTDFGRGIAVEPNGDAYLAGTTSSINFPTLNATQSSYGGSTDAFFTKLDAVGTTLFSTYLGGNGTDQGYGVAVNSTGNAYVTGVTFSSNFPTAGTRQTSYSGSSDIFVSKFNAAVSSLDYSIFHGGTFGDQGFAIAVDAAGSAYVTGSTNSPDFPSVDPVQARSGGGTEDAFVLKLNPVSEVVYSTYLGGFGSDQGLGIGVHQKGGAYVVGNTYSPNFPTVSPLQAASGGNGDGFLARIGSSADMAISVAASRETVQAGNDLVYTLTVKNAGPSNATAVTVNSAMTGNPTVVSSTTTQGACSSGGSGNVTCALGDMAAQASATVTILMRPGAAGMLSNTVNVTAAEFDPVAANNTATHTAQVSARPSIAGRVLGVNGEGLAGVTVTLGGAQTATTTTDAIGYYQFVDLTAGRTYSVTPAKVGYTFNPLSQTLSEVTQDASANFSAEVCGYSLSLSNISVGSAGGTGSVAVKANGDCFWTATSSVPWITVTSSADGRGNGVVAFSVTSASAPRSGLLTIAGQPFVVWQEFDSCGAPGFQEVRRYAVSMSPTELVTSDFNHDGKLDLAALQTLQGQNRVAVLLGNGSGGFGTPAYFAAGGNNRALASGDLNGDGHVDLIATDLFAIQLLFGDGAGNFSAPNNFTVGTHFHYSSHVADFNGDGKLDLAVTYQGADNRDAVSILLGNGNGTFGAPLGLYAGGVADLADLNNDGKPDLIIVNGNNTVIVRLGDGAGGFAAAITSPLLEASTLISAKDVNGDGKVDVVASGGVLLGNGAGGFGPALPINGLPSQTTRWTISDDFNNDAKPDLAAMTNDGLLVFVGDGNGKFGSPATFASESGNSPVVADFNGDSRPDVAMANYSGAVSVFLNSCQASPGISISGRVTDASGAVIHGAYMRLSSPKIGTIVRQADQSGNYIFRNLSSDDDYTLVPETFPYIFNSRTINHPTADQVVNFTGTLLTFNISGRIADNLGRPGIGITITLSGAGLLTTQTDANGNYVFPNMPANAFYSVLLPPSNVFSFPEPIYALGYLAGDRVHNPIAVRRSYSLSGQVKDERGSGLSGINISLGGEQSGSVVTGGNGEFNIFNLPAGFNYSLTPSAANLNFNPQSLSVFLNSSKAGLIFTATPPPAEGLRFSAANYHIGEGAGRAIVTITRSGASAVAASVEIMTIDDAASVPCNPAAMKPDGTRYPQGAAYARCDYATTIETVTFAAGDTQPKTVQIPLVDDGYAEGDETVQLKLFNPTGTAIVDSGIATVTISDNDVAGAANPIFTTPFFVRMQYLDFLSREPEADEPWSRILNDCPNVNNDSTCDRILVSNSFFGSPEFRLKGFYAFTFYRVAFDRRPAYEEIIPDMRSVSGATAAEVYQKRAAYPANFIARAEFKALYDALDNTAFVNKLLDRYALASITSPDPANPEGGTKVLLTRADLINRLGAAGAQSLTRAQVLRAVVEASEVGAAEYNRAFVAMQYYGYLRRAPEEDGYQAWLRVINQDPNNIRIMVNGFMNSPEYRLRFGQP